MNNQDALDPRLQQLYRQLPKEQPSPELDEKILAAADVGAKKRLSWYVPFSMAASLVMVSSLVLYLAKQPETLEQAIATSSSNEKRVAESKVAAPAPTNEKNSELLSGGSANVHPQTEREKPLVMAKSHASMAMDDKTVDELKDLQVEQRQNSIDLQSKEIKEEVANFAPLPQPAIAKQDHLDDQANDNLSSINQSVIADRVMQEQRALATARRSESVGAVAKMQAEKKVMAERHEEKAKLSVMKPTALTIEGVGLGMNGEQLQEQGFNCETNTCSQTLSHPQQVSYWGVASQNAQINAVLSNNIVMSLSLTQKTMGVETVQESLVHVGVASQKFCTHGKGEWVLSRQLETTIIQLSAMDDGVVLTICSN